MERINDSSLIKRPHVCNPYGGEQQRHCGSCGSLQ